MGQGNPPSSAALARMALPAHACSERPNAVKRKMPVLKRAASQRLDEWAPTLLKSRLYGQLLVDIIIGRLAPGE